MVVLILDEVNIHFHLFLNTEDVTMAKTSKMKKISIQTRNHWKLICVIACFSYNTLNIPLKIREKLHKGIWARQDGYGAPGLNPAQGYDWSGIRDSSEEAMKSMYHFVKNTLKKNEIIHIEYTKIIY